MIADVYTIYKMNPKYFSSGPIKRLTVGETSALLAGGLSYAPPPNLTPVQ